MLEQYERNQTCPGAQAEKNQHAALPARATHLVQAAINGKSVNLTKIANSVSENEERTPTCPFPLLPQRPGARLLPLPLPSPRSSGGSEPPKGSFPSPPAPVALQEVAREQKNKSTAYIIEWIALKVAPSTQGPAFAFSQAQCWQIRILGEKGGDFTRARPRARGVALSPAQGLMEKQKQPLARRRSRTEMGRAPQRWASAWLRAGLKLYFGLSGEGLLHQKLVLANWGPTSQAAILKPYHKPWWGGWVRVYHRENDVSEQFLVYKPSLRKPASTNKGFVEPVMPLQYHTIKFGDIVGYDFMLITGINPSNTGLFWHFQYSTF